jgi:hypothetical protein
MVKCCLQRTLGLNPEVLEPQIIERLNDRFDIFQNKKNTFVFMHRPELIE